MPTRIADRTIPGYVNLGTTREVLIAVGFMTAVEMGFPALPFTVLTGNAVESDPLMIAGFNSFMLLAGWSVPGGTTDFQYRILDPITQTGLILRTIALGFVNGFGTVSFVGTFGAASATAPVGTRGDVFHTMTLRITANGADQTFSYLSLWCGVR